MWEMQIPASSDGSATETVTATGSAASNASTPRFVLPPGKELSRERERREGEGDRDRDQAQSLKHFFSFSRVITSKHNCLLKVTTLYRTQQDPPCVFRSLPMGDGPQFN